MPAGGNQLSQPSILNSQTVTGLTKRGSTATDRIVGGTNSSAGQTANWTNCIKREAEAPFAAVRIKIHGRDAAQSNGWTFAVAATSTAKTSNASQLFRPTRDGINFITTLASEANPDGWRAGTWGGLASANVGAGASFLPGESPWSDWIPCDSMPRTDGGKRPLLMLRIYHDGTTNPFSGPSGPFGVTQWNSPEMLAKDYHRLYQSGIINAANGVANLTLEPGSLAGSGFWVSIQYAFKVPSARSVLVIADSIGEANATQLPGNVFGCYALRACARASTPSRPITFINAGYSAQNSSVFIPAGLAAADSLLPTDIVMHAGSPNDGPTSKFIAATSMAKVLGVVSYCTSNRINLFLVTMVPNQAWTTPQDLERISYNNQIRALCNSGVATLVDNDFAVSANTQPPRYKPGYNFDDVHPGDFGTDFESYLLRDALLSTW
jgi:hypothetical protein